MGSCDCMREFCCCLVRVVRWIPVVFVSSVIVWASYAYLFELCFFHLYVEKDAKVRAGLYGIVFIILMLLFVASYARTIFMPVGFPPRKFYFTREWQDEIKASRDESTTQMIINRFVHLQGIPVRNRNYDGGYRYCVKCSCVKPDRAHHCSVCGQCVLKFDHHCPWVNTCVNFYNYKFFILFLGYGFTLCIFGMATNLETVINFFEYTPHKTISSIQLGILFLLSAVFSISLAALFFYHLYLTARNRTTFESFRSPMLENGREDKHFFNLGVRRNYREIFGESPWQWFLPTWTSLGEGCIYPERGQREACPVSWEGNGITFHERSAFGERYSLLRTVDEDDDLLGDDSDVEVFSATELV
ncbi:hypothetical protein QR680_012129 [Steinernema hermaphroditum]|uniref:Palmitoyltransferase n=1 Tax=Steinernema hermaphroditum TaxID=289476 RepID=A0AA39I0Z6_9BILA|nr:hypothetical protein QR680_012129 [Steinernema hermaphroditum]